MTAMTATDHSAAVDRNLVADTLCAELSSISWGRAARLLAGQAAPMSRVHVLPTFLWVRPAGGRKESDGHLHPLAVRWDGGPVHVVRSDESVEVAWSAEGLGMTRSGVCTLSAAPASGVFEDGGSHHADALVGIEAARLLDGLVADEEPARWRALMILDDWVRYRSQAANQSISLEISDGDSSRGVLDDEQLEEAITQVVFGSEGRHGRMRSALDRVTDPAASLSVDPVRYLSAEASRSISEAIRDQIGDPQIGPKIRRLARKMGIGIDLDDLVAEYQRLYPHDRLGRARAIQALTSAPRIEAHRDTVEISEIDRWLR